MTPRALVALVLLAACAAPTDEPEPQPTDPQQVTLTATDNAFSGPDSIAPGMTRFTLANNGQVAHHVILGRLAEGKTLQDVMAFMESNPTGEPDWITWQGGVGATMPGDSSSAISDLPAGRYVAFCFLSEPPDNVPHVAKGMTREFVVAGDPVSAAAPEVTATITMRDFAFEVPELSAGTHTFRIHNAGEQTHEVFVVRLNDGVTGEQFMAAAEADPTGMPPGTPLGGNGAISSGLSNYLTLNLEPGRYLVLCFVPDPADGVPHAMKGMVREVVIS
jgi:hypothetical protein